ncbi:MAG: hypothetical protein ACQEQ4_05640 [Fibrobacterota bacterium]
MVGKKLEEEISIKLNLLFNNLILFGPNHPSHRNASADLAEIIRRTATLNHHITLLKNGESFYIGKHCVDTYLNVSRTAGQFQKTSLESITFKQNVSSQDIAVFGGIYIEAVREQKNYEYINSALEKQGIHTIITNYVTLREVTKQQKIIDGDNFNEGGDNSLNKEIYRGVESLVGGSGSPFSQKSGEQTGEDNDTDHLKEKVALLRSNLNGDSTTDTQMSYDEIFSSLIDISSQLKDEKKIEQRYREMGNNENDIVSECEKLTIETAVKIITEEYHKNNTSPERTAFLLKRITSDPGEIKKILPPLKNQLLKAGVPYDFFISVINALQNELSSNMAFDTLFEKADAMGVEKEELIRAIGDNPEESAKLLVQSAELKDLGNSSDISDYISEMIEKAGKNILEKKDTETTDSSAVSDIVKTIESKLLSGIKEQMGESKLYEEIESKIAARYPETLEKIKNEWIVDTIGTSDTIDTDKISQMLYTVIDKSQDVDTYKKLLTDNIDKLGLSPEEIENILTAAAQKKEKTRKNTSSVNILNPKITTYFLKRHVEEHNRYNHPFTVLALSNPRDPDISITEKIASLIGESLRYLDMIGHIFVRSREITILILPMTPRRNSTIVYNRVQDCLKDDSIILSSQSLENTADNPEDYEELMKRLLKLHMKHIAKENS